MLPLLDEQSFWLQASECAGACAGHNDKTALESMLKRTQNSSHTWISLAILVFSTRMSKQEDRSLLMHSHLGTELCQTVY